MSHHRKLQLGDNKPANSPSDQRGVTQQTVAAEAGIANSTLSAVLTGHRALTLKHVEKLAAYFGVEPAVFLPGNG